jgi:hypothetical protein
VTADANVTVELNETAMDNETDTGDETTEEPTTTEAPTDGNETDDNETATASVTFEDQTSNGTTVNVSAVSLPEDGYVAIHNDSLLEGEVTGSVVGVSEYLEAGDYENLTVELFDVSGADFAENQTLTENQTLIAMPHVEDSGNETYDFVASGGTDDGPFVADGVAVTADANVTVELNETAAAPENETET